MWPIMAMTDHDKHIEKLKGQELLLNNAIAHAQGNYEYEIGRMQDMEPGSQT